MGGGCLHCVMVKALKCRIVEVGSNSSCAIMFTFWTNTLGKDINPLIFPAMGHIVLLLFL